MDKINFQNLPNQTTPVNATNLNQLQTNVDNGKVETEVNAVSNIDANNCLKSGFYYLGSGCSNVPESYIRLTVNGSSTSGDIVQIAVGLSTNNNIYIRKKINNSWDNWTDISPMKSGAWTPTLSTIEGAAPTVDYTITSGARRGSYKTIGNMVYIDFYIRGRITALTGTNNYAIITGLPFTAYSNYALGECAISLGALYNCMNGDPSAGTLEIFNNRVQIQNSVGAGSLKWKVTPSNEYFILAGSGWYKTE